PSSTSRWWGQHSGTSLKGKVATQPKFDRLRIARFLRIRMSEPACAPGRLQSLDLLPAHPCDRRHHQLGDAVTAADRHRLVAEVDDQDLHFVAIIGVDRAG